MTELEPLARDSPPPSPDVFQRELAAFAKDLRSLRISHGNPSLQKISELAGLHGRGLVKSTLSDIFNGVRLPEFDSLMSLVPALLISDSPALTSSSQRVSRDDPRLEEWRTRWKRLKGLQTESQDDTVANPEPDQESAPELEIEPDLESDLESTPEPEPEPEPAPERALSPAALLKILRRQLAQPLSDDEYILLDALAFPAPRSAPGRPGLNRIAETAVTCLSQASAGHITSVLRSLTARGFLQPGPDGHHTITDAAIRALARRRTS